METRAYNELLSRPLVELGHEGFDHEYERKEGAENTGEQKNDGQTR
jgi:hypothetical protein